eukprot:7034564-Pyramimonas_sp.AAC.1
MCVSIGCVPSASSCPSRPPGPPFSPSFTPAKSRIGLPDRGRLEQLLCLAADRKCFFQMLVQPTRR